jgi:hypothetical protein
MRSLKNKAIKPLEKLSDIDILEIKLLYNCLNTTKLTTENSEIERINKYKKGLIFNIK